MSGPKSVQTLEQLMTYALAMERDAVERYTELAAMMATHNNPEVAELFRKMAGHEGEHVTHILATMGWSADSAPVPAAGAWGPLEAPDAVPMEEMHYLMHPWHALQLARAAEQRAVEFFEAMAGRAANDQIRRAADELRAEEVEHVALIEGWLAKVAPPEPDWAEDPDPPRYID